MAGISIFVGTVYGSALSTARAVAEALRGAGHQVALYDRDLDLSQLTGDDRAILICTSTTGSGDIPPNLLPLYLQLRDRFPLLNGRPFGVITLGDSSYFDTYGAAGQQMEELLLELGGHPLKERLLIDALETTTPEEDALPWALDWASRLKS